MTTTEKHYDLSDVPYRMRAVRAHLGLSVSEAAERLGLHASTVRRLERVCSGKETLPTLRAICIGYEVKLDWLWAYHPRDPVIFYRDGRYVAEPLGRPVARLVPAAA